MESDQTVSLMKEEWQMDLMSLIRGQLNNTGVLQQLGQSVGADADMDDIQGLLGKFLK